MIAFLNYIVEANVGLLLSSAATGFCSAGKLILDSREFSWLKNGQIVTFFSDSPSGFGKL